MPTPLFPTMTDTNPIDLQAITQEAEASAKALQEDWKAFETQFETVENLRSNGKLTPQIEDQLYTIFAEACKASNLALSFLTPETEAPSTVRSTTVYPKI